jgi:bacterioferritin
MKGNAKVIDFLKEVLKGEITAISQYFLHAEMCENWGYHKLAKYVKHESIDEMRHAEALIERILFLESIPNLKEMFPLRIGKDVKAQFENDLAVELDAIPRLNKAIAASVEAGDNGSRELFEKILVDEEKHVDWLEAQLEMIEQMGLGVYLSQQMGEEAAG